MICKADVCLQTIRIFCKQLMVSKHLKIKISFYLAYWTHFEIVFDEY
jgi:hypothetical protein